MEYDSPNKQVEIVNKKRKLLSKLIPLLIIIAVIFVIILLIRGRTATYGSYPDDIHTETLICSKDNVKYDVIKDIKTESTNATINMIFEGTATLQSIYIKYMMDFSSPEVAERARPTVGITFTDSLHAAGYNYGDFASKASVINSSVLVEAYAKKYELTTQAAPFFLISTNSRSSDLPLSMQDYRSNYTSQGFLCESTLDSN